MCKFYCRIGLKLQEYGKQLIGEQENDIPDPMKDIGLSIGVVETIKSKEFKQHLKLRKEGLTVADAKRHMNLTASDSNRFRYAILRSKAVGIDVWKGEHIKSNVERVVGMNAAGISVKDIAFELGIQPNTVYTYRKRGSGSDE